MFETSVTDDRSRREKNLFFYGLNRGLFDGFVTGCVCDFFQELERNR